MAFPAAPFLNLDQRPQVAAPVDGRPTDASDTGSGPPSPEDFGVMAIVEVPQGQLLVLVRQLLHQN